VKKILFLFLLPLLFAAPAAAAPAALVVLREAPAVVEEAEAAALAAYLARALGAAGLPAPVVCPEPPSLRFPEPETDGAAGPEETDPAPVPLSRAERLAIARESAPPGAGLAALVLRAYAPAVGGGGGVMVPLPPELGGGAPTRPERAYIMAELFIFDLPAAGARSSGTLRADSAARAPLDPDEPSALSGTLFEKYRGRPMEQALLELAEALAAHMRPLFIPPARAGAGEWR
jgi:hypothetical protein